MPAQKKFGKKKQALIIAFHLLSLFFGGLACQIHSPVKTSSTSFDLNFEARLEEAHRQLNRGCYRGLTKAWEILKPLLSQSSPWPELKSKVWPEYIKCGLLLALREKELGLNTSTLNEFSSLTDSDKTLSSSAAELQELIDFYEIVKEAPIHSKGIMAYDEEQFEAKPKVQAQEKWPKDLERRKKEAEHRLKRMIKRAQEDEIAAYFWLTAYDHYFFYQDSELKPQTLLALFPRSRLVRFKMAITSSPLPRRDLLEELLLEEPEFYEAHYFLGEEAFRRGLLLAAERHYFEARQGLPPSPIMAISLASVYFHLEELEKSLEMYEEALQLLPGYREAMLGKAICLSYLHRHDEAMKCLQTMIDLGYWLLGEAHYWMAWNLYHLTRYEEALNHCFEAQRRLPTSSEVFSLTGTVALELNLFLEAEENFNQALAYEANQVEALVGLARLEARRENWLKAGEYYERASLVYENQSQAIRAKIKEIEASDMSEERKLVQLKRKEGQLENLIQTKAACLYYGAICYFHAGFHEKALKLAEEAASHLSFKTKASELILKIKNKKNELHCEDKEKKLLIKEEQRIN